MISIIVPVLNEAKHLGPFLDELKSQAGNYEVILADGGSEDATIEICRGRAKITVSSAGRGIQMNAGAAKAKGDIFLFLHCDTRLPSEGLILIKQAMRDPATAGGGFIHRFDQDNWFNKFISLSANIRSRRWGLLFGDQAIFTRREVFEELGGYPEIPLFEDWSFSAKMHNVGKIALIQKPITTSGRRIEVWGKWRCFLLWWGLSALYAVGLPPEKLARFYRHVR